MLFVKEVDLQITVRTGADPTGDTVVKGIAVDEVKVHKTTIITVPQTSVGREVMQRLQEVCGEARSVHYHQSRIPETGEELSWI